MTLLVSTLNTLYALRDNAVDNDEWERSSALQAAIDALIPLARKEV